MAHDTADLRQLMYTALLASDDKDMIEMLHVGREEMPEAIKALQRALEKEVTAGGRTDGTKEVASGVSPVISAQSHAQVSEIGADGSVGVDVGEIEKRATVGIQKSERGSGNSRRKDTLDREFIESVIDALKKYQVTEESLPSWTITRCVFISLFFTFIFVLLISYALHYSYEIDREEKIGMGFFSDVYRGTWGRQTVAIKVLAPSVPNSIFRREVEIWKTLRHVNVLELYGASSATGDPPWFFVSPYLKRGNLVNYLKSLSNGNELDDGEGGKMRSESNVIGGDEKEVADVDMLKMMHEVARGMEYLHCMGVLHGDLKVCFFIPLPLGAEMC
jgi:abelson tyrosine-protein kinase 1